MPAAEKRRTAFPSGGSIPPVTTTRIERFAEEVQRDAESAAAALDRDRETARGPIVEAIEGSTDVLVTFVHVGPATSVRLLSELCTRDLDQHFQGVPMTRVGSTDVWYASVPADPRTVVPYQFLIDPPALDASVEAGFEDYLRRIAGSSRVDPHNPIRHRPPFGPSDDDGYESVLELPGADQFDFLDGTPLSGRNEQHTVTGTALPGQREVTVYLPPGHDPHVPRPVVVLLDGEHWLQSGRADEILDTAIARGAVPPVIAVFWHNLTPASRDGELACHPALPAALADELLPWLRTRHGATSDPAQVIVGGLSLGGLASAWTLLQRPDAFGGALLVSPSLWFTPPDVTDDAPEGPGGWITQQYAASATRSGRVHLAVGSLETGPLPFPGMNGRSMVDLARQMRDTVASSGVDLVGYREQPGGHNLVTAQRVLVPGLAGLLRGSGRPHSVPAP